MTRRVKRHAALRKAIHGSRFEFEDFAGLLGLTMTGLYKKLSGMIPWKLAEVYKVMQLLEIPAADICTYFPEEDQSITSTH